jgi:hypothetical protein
MEIAIGIVITLLVALLGLLLNHISQCSKFHERLASMEAEVRAGKHEFGDHDAGIRLPVPSQQATDALL